ncbi:alpha/beta fold hydrolase [Geodermatophilus marinus]|uniref:alpha/beta fold hydrolase n=1 Tax=Geodermatophilus sp. LHW52908 TaxID=2303986 RepID=UPI0018F7D024|nr:alpha/beta hydrolase [Geodermatophilus sp. LHW52908]
MAPPAGRPARWWRGDRGAWHGSHRGSWQRVRGAAARDGQRGVAGLPGGGHRRAGGPRARWPRRPAHLGRPTRADRRATPGDRLQPRYARPNEAIAPGAADPMPVHVDDLVALLRALGAAPAHLVGNSWGAFICLLTALRYPHVVHSLVLEEPPLLPLVLGSGARPQPAVLARALRRRPRATLAVLAFGLRTSAPMAWAYGRGDVQRALRIFARGVLGRQALARLTPQRRQQMRDSAAELQAEFRAGFPPLAESQVRDVRVPTLLLTGERSPTVVRALSEWLADLLPDVEQVVVPGASHLVHEDAPAFVNDAVLGFVTRR